MKKGVWIFNFITGLVFLMHQMTEVCGQQLIGLTENQEIKKAALESSSRKKTTVNTASLSLPFFEDFSILTVYPDPEKWANNFAFVNSSFPDMPPSIGVATLDAIDAEGNVYAINNRVTPSDTLTSTGLNLLPYKSTSKKVILSFFYQAGGKGELPDPQDSLVLEYFSVSKNKWVRDWKASATSYGPFLQYIREIADSLYEDGFRFRFRNYTSMSPDETIGKYGALSNVDQWHIDYIRVDTNSWADHVNSKDLTLVEPLKDLLKLYVTIPWNHLNFAQSIVRNWVRYVIRVPDLSVDSLNFARSYYVTDMLQHTVDDYEIFPQEIPTDTVVIRNDPFNHPFTQTSADYGQYEVTAYISPPASQYRGNDTVKYIQLFKDYYAYDDGTPEFGIGISGESTNGAMIACRFPIFRQDTIRGVDIFFNKTRNHYTANLTFNLCIWKNEGNQPGDTLYISKEEYAPDANLGLLEFKRYQIPLTHEIVVSDTVFVGIMQLSEDFMNIGFDVSHDNLKNVMFNTTGTWYTGDNLEPAGTIMIRPVFSTKSLPSGLTGRQSENEILAVFPVPANDLLHITFGGSPLMETAEIQVYDLSGRHLLSQRSAGTLSVSQLNPGLYLLRIRLQNGQNITSKFIVRR